MRDSGKMIVFCATLLLLLHLGSSLVPVTTVQLGESVTLECVLPFGEMNVESTHWFKQSAGGNLKFIVSQRKVLKPVYASDVSASRLVLQPDRHLTILRTIEEDEGMYHCGLADWIKISWSGTFLLITGNDQRKSSNSVVQWLTVSDPVHPGDPVTLQCSVLSDSDDTTCPADYKTFWFRAGSDRSLNPNVLYIDGNTHKECNKTSDNQKSCLYHFSKKVSASDSGTYYCAVATCGEILFGNGTKVEIEGTATNTALVIVTVCLVISVTGNIVFMCYRSSAAPCKARASSQARHDSVQQVHDGAFTGDDLNYAGLYFSGRKSTRELRRTGPTEDSVYSQVKR